MMTMKTERFIILSFISISVHAAIFDLSGVYPTNDWAEVEYPRTLCSNECLTLTESSYTNLTLSSLTIPLSDDAEFIIQDSVSRITYRIRIGLCESVPLVRERMVENFSMCSAAHPFPLFVDTVNPIGDRAYQNWNPTVVNGLSFIRNNAYINVISETETNSVVPLARLIDMQLHYCSTNIPPTP